MGTVLIRSKCTLLLLRPGRAEPEEDEEVKKRGRGEEGKRQRGSQRGGGRESAAGQWWSPHADRAKQITVRAFIRPEMYNMRQQSDNTQVVFRNGHAVSKKVKRKAGTAADADSHAPGHAASALYWQMHESDFFLWYSACKNRALIIIIISW